MRISDLIISLIFILAVSCNGEGSSSVNKKTGEVENKNPVNRVSLVKIDQPSDGDEFDSGDIIELKLELLTDTIPDSVRVFFDGKQRSCLKNGVLEYGIETGSSRLGRIPLKIVAYSGESRPQTLTVFVIIISDIEPEIYKYRVLNTFQHDENAYTQGLLYHNGFLYESTGQEGRSSLRKVDLESGEVLQLHNLDSKFFGEGLVLFNNMLYQLTWTSKVGFVYDLDSFDEIRRIHYATQGWGLTTDGEELIMSDGTNKLYFLEPEYFTVMSSIEVYDNEKAVWQLNELEYINGEIWANIYMTDKIARIDPATGKVLAYIDLTNILPPDFKPDDEEVLNGIAWDEEGNRLFVTGKNWPWLFHIGLIER